MSVPRQMPRVREARDLSWWDRANCLGSHPDLFFTGRGESTAEAKQVCAGCVVRDECLTYALDMNIEHGIWGGLSRRQRKRLRRDAKRSAA